MSDNKVYIPFIVFFFNSINDYPVKKKPNPDTTVINAKGVGSDMSNIYTSAKQDL